MPADAAATKAPPTHLILIDGSGYIFRAFHALPPMTRGDGTPVNAVFGFTNMLARFMRDHTGTHLAVVFDAGRTTFRNRLYDQYKAQRPEPPPELIPQFKLVRDATAAFGVPCIELDDWEADDLIATYAREAEAIGMAVTIVSSDKDLMQLIRPGVVMLDPIKQKTLGPAEVMEKFGVPPDKVVEVQALMGDSIDNVPGVPGIGPKNAAELIQSFGDVEAVLAAAPTMKPSKRRDNLIAYAEAARISRKLVELCDKAPLPLPLDTLAATPPDNKRLSDFLHSMGFRSTALRLGLENEPAPATAAPVEEKTDAPYGDYETISTADRLAGWLQQATAARKIALHIQTDGNPRPWRAALLGIAFATEAGRAAYWPLPGAELTEPRLALADVAAEFTKLLTDQSVLKIVPNAKYAGLVLRQAGLPPPSPVSDPSLVAYAQTAGAHDHGLSDLAPLHLGHTPKSLDETTGTGRNRLGFAQVPVAAATAYAALRTTRTPPDPRVVGNGMCRHPHRRHRTAPHVRRFRHPHGCDGDRRA
jgi:DNA polymerase-1